MSARRTDERALVARAHDAIRAGSRSFALAARLYDPATRDGAMLLYAWCRHCDDVVDGQRLGAPSAGGVATSDGAAGQADRGAARGGGSTDDIAARIASLRRATDDALAGRAADWPFEALALAVRRHAIAHRLAHEHLDGFAMDAAGCRYESLQSLRGYCWRVAGVVGLMMARVMGVRDAATLDRAGELGIAMQLTNIARDLVDDARADRVYVPRDWLRAAGLAEDRIADPACRDRLVPIAARLLDAADAHYAAAAPGIHALPWRSAWAVVTAATTYRAIGMRVRARGASAWDGRSATSRAHKLALAALALGRVASGAARAGSAAPMIGRSRP